MPLANPEASFEVAARHLFRHLGEPTRLRRNPLVRRFFGEGGGRMTRAREKAALATIMRLIEDGAEAMRRLDVEANHGERAFRQYTIVRRTYFERAPIPQIAADIGLSIRQYYRERSLICARIARYVQSSDARTVSVASFSRLEPLRFQMEQAAQRQELGDADAAASGYALVLRGADNAATKIETLCRLAELASERGTDRDADAHLGEARRILACDGYELVPIARAAAGCDVALVRSRLAWETARPRIAADWLAEAARIAERIAAEGGKRVRDLYAEVLLERGARSADLGNFAAALDDVIRAAEVQRAARDYSLRQRSDALRMRTLFEMTAPEPLKTPAQGLAPLGEALELARACGSAKRVILATGALAVTHRYGRDDRSAADAAVRSVLMATHVASRRFRASAAIVAADSLLNTKYWKRGLRLLRGPEAALILGSFEWVKLQHLQAEYHNRSGRYLESHVYAVTAEREARAYGSPRLQGAALRDLALSAHAFGRAGEAREYVREALTTLERHGSALSRTLTTRVAALIA